jgi:hypothetical protein
MDGVRAVLHDDKILWELLNAPFMLNIVTLAFKDKPSEYIRGTGTLDERRKQIFDAYKDAMFDRPLRGVVKKYNYTRQQTEHWLSWLANSMKRHNQRIFYLELMQSNWLPSIRLQRMLKVGVLLIICLIFGLVFGLTYGLVFGLVSGLVLGLSVGLIAGLIEKPGGLVGGLGFGLIVGLIGGLLTSVEQKKLDTRMYPNEGIHTSVKNALTMGLFFGLAGALVFGLVGSLLVESSGLDFGLFFGLVFGLSCGLTYGGINCIQHYLLRIMLRICNLAPLDYVKFLDYSADRIFLRKFGGDYVFIHGMIMDYFASLEPDRSVT